MNILFKFRSLLIYILNLSIKFPKAFLAVFFSILFFILFSFQPLEIHLTIDQLINKDFKSTQDYFQLKKEFKINKQTTLIVKSPNRFDSFDLCNFRHQGQRLIISHPEFSHYFSPIYLRKTEFKLNSDPPTLNFPYSLNFNCDSNNLVDFKNIANSPWNKIILNSNHSVFLHEIEMQNENVKNFDAEIVPLRFEILKSYFQNITKLDVHFSGDMAYQYYFKKGLDFNNSLNLLIIIIIAIIFRIYFGTYLSSLLFILTVVMSTLILFGLMSIFQVPIDILNNSLILLLTVSSLGDFVFLSSEEIYSNKHWSNSFRSIICPSFFTSFTTFIGFISLCTSDIEVIRRLGLWGGLSGIIEWLVVMLVLPAGLKLFLKSESWVKRSHKVHFKKTDRFFNKIISKQLSFVLLFFILFIPYSIQHLNINDNPSELFNKSNPFRESLNILKENFNFAGDVSLVFNNKNLKSENLQKIQQLKQFNIVSHIENPYENLDYFLTNTPEKYHSLIESNLSQTPQFMRFFSENKMRAVIYLKKIDMREIERLRQYVSNSICQDHSCYLSGSLIAYADFSQKVPSTLIQSFLFSIILVVITIIFLAYFSGNQRHVIKLSLSSIWGVSVLLFFIWFFQIEMNFVTSVVVSILVGMTGDNSIQYIIASLDNNLEKGINNRFVGSFINTMTMIACSFIFLLYAFEPPKIFGTLLIFGLFLALVGDYWILKGLMKRPLPNKGLKN